MTRALVWKELREQWVVWLTTAVVAVASVVALRLLLPHRYSDEALQCILWLGAWVYGLVCGALLLAGETEDGTQNFLDMLPATRGRLWQTKAWAGLALLAAQVAILAAADHLFIRMNESFDRGRVELLGLVVFGIAGYAFGLYSGSRAATVLGAIGRGALVQTAIGLTVYPFLASTLREAQLAPEPSVPLLALTAVAGAVAAGVAVRSRQIYCRAGGEREFDVEQPAGHASRPDRDDLFRGAWWDARRLAAAMAAVGLLATVAVGLLGPFAWPVSAALIGLCCGLSAAFVKAGTPDRHATGQGLFTRAAVCFAIALAASSLTVLVPLAMSELSPGGNSGTDVVDALARRFQAAPAVLPRALSFDFLPAWLVSGFAVGLLCGNFADGSLGAGLLALPGACLLATLLAIAGVVGSIDAWRVWSIPAGLSAAAGTATWLRAGRGTAEATSRQRWDERFRRAGRVSSWFAAGMAAVSVVATVFVTLVGWRAWPITTTLIGLGCGFSAGAGETRLNAAGDSGANRRVGAGHSFARVVVCFAIALGSSLLAVFIPLLIFATSAAIEARREAILEAEFHFRAMTEVLPSSQSFASLPAWILNSFAVGLMCGFFARGSFVAGCLTIPAACFFVAIILDQRIFGRRVNDLQAWGVPLVLLASASLAQWSWGGGKVSSLRSAALVVVAVGAAMLWLVMAG